MYNDSSAYHKRNGLKMKTYKCYLFLSVLALLISCISQRQSVITSVNYDEKKNVTTYLVLPYGSAELPGKWAEYRYISESNQQVLINADSIRVALAFNRYNGYEFNTDGAKKGFEFVKAFYDWESTYFRDTHRLQSTIIEQDTARNFIVWRLFGTASNGGVLDTYFLIGEKNGNVSNFSIMVTKKWETQRKIQFVKDLFLAKPEN